MLISFTAYISYLQITCSHDELHLFQLSILSQRTKAVSKPDRTTRSARKIPILLLSINWSVWVRVFWNFNNCFAVHPKSDGFIPLTWIWHSWISSSSILANHYELHLKRQRHQNRHKSLTQRHDFTCMNIIYAIQDKS